MVINPPQRDLYIMQRKLSVIRNSIFIFIAFIISIINVAHAELVPSGQSITMITGSSPQFSCDTLYGGPDGTSPRIFEIDHKWTGGGVIPTTDIFRGTAIQHGSTIALGPAGSASGLFYL